MSAATVGLSCDCCRDSDATVAANSTAILYTTKPEDSWTGELFSGVKVTVWFQRRYQHDLYYIGLVQCALTSLVAGVWSIDGHTDIEDRIASDFTLVLAGVAMKFVLSQNLPPVSYVTMMEVCSPCSAELRMSSKTADLA